MLSKIEKLLLKRSFQRKEIDLQEKYLKHKKKYIQQILFSFRLFFLSLHTKIKKNYVIQINQESFFQENDLIQPGRFHISKLKKLLPNSAICLQEFCFGNFISNGFSH